MLEPYLSQSVRIRESHERAVPMVRRDPRHELAEEFAALYEAIAAPKRRKVSRPKR